MRIHDSIHAILQRQEIVADLFYAIYLDRHPEIRRYFVGVDLKRQAVLLSMALMLIAHHYQHHYPATASYLKILGHQHATRRGIPPESYGPFRDCLLEMLEQFHGADWDDALAREWREAIDEAAALMLQGYAEPASI